MTDASSLYGVNSVIEVLGAQVMNQDRKRAPEAFENPKSCRSQVALEVWCGVVGSGCSHSTATGQFTPTTQGGEFS